MDRRLPDASAGSDTHLLETTRTATATGSGVAADRPTARTEPRTARPATPLVLRRARAWFTRAADALSLTLALALLGVSVFSVLYAALAFLALNYNDPKHLRLTPRVSEDVWTIVGRMALPVVLMAPLGAFQLETPLSLSRVFMVTVGFVLLGRGIAYAVQRRLRAARKLSAPTLVVGAGPLGQKLVATLGDHPEYGLDVVGVVDSAPPAELADQVLGTPAELPELLVRHGIERVVVAYGAISGSRMVPILRACDELDVTVYHVPRFFELGVLPNSTEHEDVWGVPLVRFRRSGLRRSARVVKRVTDLAVSGVALLLLSPLLLALAVAVRVTSPGPVLFRQTRIGQDGREFELLKFRTMEVNDDSQVTWSVVGDARLTSIGGLLRKTSMDELPQLINILRGDMSIVGPRPERPHFVQQFGSELPGYHARHRVPVGLTGWSQVHGLRGDTSIEERVRLDNYYIENWSLWMDIVIILRTVNALKTPA